MEDRKPLSIRQLRVLWVAVSALDAVFVWFAETHGKTIHRPLTIWHWIVILLAVWSAWGGYSLRRKLAAQGTSGANDQQELVFRRKWSAVQMAAMVAAQSIVLWGIVAKFVLASPNWFAVPFYVAGYLLFILWYPQSR